MPGAFSSHFDGTSELPWRRMLMRLGPFTSAKVDTVPYSLLARSKASSGDGETEPALTV